MSVRQRFIKAMVFAVTSATTLVLAASTPAGSAEEQAEFQVDGCSAVQLRFRVPISRVEKLVPEPFEIKQELDDLPGETLFILTLEQCKELSIEGRDAGEVVFFHGDVNIKFPRFLYESWTLDEELAPNGFTVLGATNNPDHMAYLHQKGAADGGFVEHLRYETRQDGLFESFVFDAPEPTSSPFTVTATYAPAPPEGTGISLEPNGYSLVPRGVLIVDDDKVSDLRAAPVTQWDVTTEPGSLLDRILCDVPRSSDDPRAAARTLDPAHAAYSAGLSVRLQDLPEELDPTPWSEWTRDLEDVECSSDA